MSLVISMDIADWDNMLNEVAEDVEAALRPAAQAGAQVFYDQVKTNLEGIGSKTGNLKSAIYQAYAKKESGPGLAVYHVSWNPQKSQHAHLLEFGFIQRYQAYLDKNGNWRTLIRPEMRGKKKPGRYATQSVKDAYYVLRKGGPAQRPAYAFLRNAQNKKEAAIAAVEAELMRRLTK